MRRYDVLLDIVVSNHLSLIYHVLSVRREHLFIWLFEATRDE
jgi:hypothetical protein